MGTVEEEDVVAHFICLLSCSNVYMYGLIVVWKLKEGREYAGLIGWCC